MNDLTYQVIGAAIEVHRALGPGLLEKVYQECLLHELSKRELMAQIEFPLSVNYDDIEIESGYRIDLLVENQLVIELKSVEAVSDLQSSNTNIYEAWRLFAWIAYKLQCSKIDKWNKPIREW